MKRKNRWVVVVFFIMVTLPLLLSFVLFLKVLNLEQQLDEVNQKLSETVIGKTASAGQADEGGMPQSVLNADGYGGILDDEVLEVVPNNNLEGKTAYLTFDDGPSSNTSGILDILNEYQVKATFFVVGKTDAESIQLYQRIVQEGHSLGMHSYSHSYSSIYASVKAFERDFNKIEALLYRTTGVESKIYRFPGGSSNSVSALPMEEFIGFLKEKHVQYYDWNAANGDALGEVLSVNQLVANTMNSVLRNENSIILMHDSDMYDTTVEALPEIITLLQANEITLLPITEETEPVQHVTIEE